MIEQKIEKIIIDRLEMMLQNTCAKTQLMGVWQAVQGKNKLEEDFDTDGVIVIKVLPRSYETPTVPYGTMDCTLVLTMRTELDGSGKKFLETCDKISTLISIWQKNFKGFRSDFHLEGEFEPTGFQTAGGDVSLDQQNSVLVFTQTFQIYGIISDVY